MRFTFSKMATKWPPFDDFFFVGPWYSLSDSSGLPFFTQCFLPFQKRISYFQLHVCKYFEFGDVQNFVARYRVKKGKTILSKNRTFLEHAEILPKTKCLQGLTGVNTFTYATKPLCHIPWLISNFKPLFFFLCRSFVEFLLFKLL